VSTSVLLILVTAGLVGAAAWAAHNFSAVFVIVFENGWARVVRGRAPAAFAADVQAICTDCRLPYAVVRGHRLGRRVTLGFSRHVPRRYRQRFRNAWALYSRSAFIRTT